MRKISTRCASDFVKKKKKELELINEPRKQTLDFLRQFARAYQAEPELCGYVVN